MATSAALQNNMKILKYILWIAAGFAAVWFSFYTEPLSERNAREALKQYNPEQLVDYCFENNLTSLSENAMSVSQLVNELNADPKALQERSGKLLGIGSNVYYIIKGEAKNLSYADNEYTFVSDGVKCRIPVKYIFGNVARDASGWFDIGDFQNTMDFNSVSACINERIKNQIVAPYVLQADIYKSCSFCAAIEVRPGQREVEELVLFPYTLSMK